MCSIVEEYELSDTPYVVFVLYWVCESVVRSKSHTFAGIPRRWERIEGKSMTIRSEHDFASLSKVEPCACDRRTIEKMQCLSSWTSWQSLCFRELLCSSPNCPSDSPCCISRKPNRVPIVMLRSAGIRWMVRNFSRSGWPFIFSIIALTTRVHRGRTMQFSIARFINCV